MRNFKLLDKDGHSQARTGLLTTAHGQVETPVFMPVGTAAAVKGITPRQLRQTGTGIVLANTYHLLLRPGVEVVAHLGGLHKLMAWNGPILTDSGGYQVFSLGNLTKINDDGIEFASHVDGLKIQLTPQLATRVQNQLGADIIMCLDECPPSDCDNADLEKAVQRTLRWARVCKQTHANSKQMLFGIVQGAANPHLRAYCAADLVKMNFDGYAIGGLGLGEGHEKMIRTVSQTTTLLPEEKPRYLMGVGRPADIIAAVRAGVDMFDCVLPTRNGRNAFAFTENGPLRLRNSTHITDTRPIESTCDCYCCTHFSRGALRHFFNVGEMLGPILVSLHNLRFYQRLMSQIRLALKTRQFTHWAGEKLRKLESSG